MTTVFIVSAPSGSGKSTLVKRLLAVDRRLRFSVSYTTRPPRGAEAQGLQYHFISREDFRGRIAAGEFLEWAQVFDNYYGTHRRCLEQASAEGVDLLLDIDVQGARQLKSKLPDAVTIFVLPPSREALEQRLRARSEDSEPVIHRRLREAAEEIRNYRWYDYVLINREVDASVDVLASIVRGARAHRTRMEEEIGPVLASFQAAES